MSWSDLAKILVAVVGVLGAIVGLIASMAWVDKHL